MVSMKTRRNLVLFAATTVILAGGCRGDERDEVRPSVVVHQLESEGGRGQGEPIRMDGNRRYSVPADSKASYEILVNEDLEDPLGVGELRRLFLSQRTSGVSAETLRELGMSRRSYSFRIVWCQPQKAAWYLGVPEGLTGFDESVRPSESQIEQARELARSIRISDIDGNPQALVPGSSTAVAVETACASRN